MGGGGGGGGLGGGGGWCVGVGGGGGGGGGVGGTLENLYACYESSLSCKRMTKVGKCIILTTS